MIIHKLLMTSLMFIYVLSIGAVLSQQTSISVCNVGCSFDHIQAAIDAAPDNTTIRVMPGIYRENLLIKGKSLTLLGDMTNPNNVVVESAEDGKPVVGITSSSSNPRSHEVSIKGITFGGTKRFRPTGVACATSVLCPWAVQIFGAVRVQLKSVNAVKSVFGISISDNTEVIIQDCKVSDNRYQSIGVSGSSRVSIARCEILNNPGQAGIALLGQAKADIQESLITNNDGFGILIFGRNSALPILATITKSTIVENGKGQDCAITGCAGITIWGPARVTIEGNVIRDNIGGAISTIKSQYIVSCKGNTISGEVYGTDECQ